MSQPALKVTFTGGGTAGHVLPAIPIMRTLRQQGAELAYIGGVGGVEQGYLADEAVPYFGIASGKLRRYFSWRNLADACSVLLGIWQSYWLLRRLRPTLIFSKGGFVSFPVVLAGWLRGIPVVAHESDLSPGLANRLAMPFLSALCTGFPIRRPGRFGGELIHSGSPVRPELLAGSAKQGRALLGAPADRPLVLITGGSLGAQALNRVARAAAPSLVDRCCLVHVCGPGKTVPMDLPGYHQLEFVSQGWGDLLAAADVVVSRAGANALFELLTLGKPNILIPLPLSASRGDQIENAAYAERAGYSRVIPERALDAEVLIAAVHRLLAEAQDWRRRLARFEAPPAVDLIVAAITRLGGPEAPKTGRAKGGGASTSSAGSPLGERHG